MWTRAQNFQPLPSLKFSDFAGGKVQLSKKVAADSRKAQRKWSKKERDDKAKDLSGWWLPGQSSKRPAGILNSLGDTGGKKAKMSVLETSRLDWDAFKSEEGFAEELAVHGRGRGGYVERRKFLKRVDHRQFDLEKAVRLANMRH